MWTRWTVLRRLNKNSPPPPPAHSRQGGTAFRDQLSSLLVCTVSNVSLHHVPVSPVPGQGGANVCRVVPVQSAVFSASADARSAAFSAEQLLAGQLVQRGAGETPVGC